MNEWRTIGHLPAPVGDVDGQLSAAVAAAGLDDEARAELCELLDVWRHVLPRNVERRCYFDGEIPVKNIGIDTVPESVNVQVSCDWPRMACTSVSERSRFDGFVFESGIDDERLDAIMLRNAVPAAYRRFVTSELQHGCMAATVAANGARQAEIRFHSAESSVMTWDTVSERVKAGLAVAAVAVTPYSDGMPVPTQLNLYLTGRTVKVERTGADSWAAVSIETGLDRPAFEAFRFRPTGTKPLGTSRITRPLMRATDAALRIMRDVQVAAALEAAPQKYLLGLSEEQFNEMVQHKQAAYVGSMLLTTTDDNGNHPAFGQLQGASLNNFTTLLSMWARQVSSMTGVPLSQLGVTSENQYYESTDSLVMAAEDLNASNGDSLRNVALMALQLEAGEVTEEQSGVMAHFKNPARPSVSAATDAITKVGAQDAEIVGTDFYYEQMGYDRAEIARIQSERARNVTAETVAGLFGGDYGA